MSDPVIEEEPTFTQLVSSIGSSIKKRNKTMIDSQSSYENNSDPEYTESEDEEAESSKFMHGGKRSKFIPNPYVNRPRTRPKNKLKLNRKLIVSPKLRDKIINIEESPEDKIKSKKKTQSKSQEQRKRSHKRVTKVEAIKIFASILDL